MDQNTAVGNSTSRLSIAEELARYDAYMHDAEGLAAGTRRNRLHRIGFLLGEVDEVSPDAVRQFIVGEQKRVPTASHASSLAATLRDYFRFRGTCGDEVRSILAVISRPAHWRLSSLPQALKPAEISRLEESFPGARRNPRRCYAILRMAIDLGLRSNEIAQLRLDDIDWQNGTITIRHAKSCREEVMPLPEATGQAIVGYLQHERRPSQNRNVILRCTAPHGEPVTPHAVSRVILRSMRRAGLDHSRPHALRHTLASRLIESGSSLKEVADVLRHQCLDVTLTYAKLDQRSLADVALPWPGAKS